MQPLWLRQAKARRRSQRTAKEKQLKARQPFSALQIYLWTEKGSTPFRETHEHETVKH